MTFVWKRILSLGMVLCMLLAAVPMTALAADDFTAVAAAEDTALIPENFTESRDTAVRQLRSGLAAHEGQITLLLRTVSKVTEEYVKAIFSDAVDPNAYLGSDPGYQGDFLLFSVTDVNINVEFKMQGAYVYNKITYDVTYLTDSAQDSQLREKAAALRETMVTQTRNDYQRCKWIYDYVRKNVTVSTQGSSAYDALIVGKANAQGIASLVYALAVNSGIDCRIVSGIAEGEECVWNLVCVYDKWYALDACCGKFLSGFEQFADHSSDPYYASESFTKLCPLNAKTFDTAAAAAGTLENGLSWKYDAAKATLTISGNGAMQDFLMHSFGSVQLVSRPWDMYVTEGAAFVVAEGVTSVGANVFYNVLFDEIKLASSVTTIGAGAFRSSRGSEIMLPAGVTSIGADAFRDSQIVKLQLPNGITTIGDRAFSGCMRLPTLRLPSGLTKLGEGVCEGCISLKSVTYDGDSWENVKVGANNKKLTDLLRDGDGGFFDVAADAWYAASVEWAAGKNITGGIGSGKFGTEVGCTRAQVVTFLWAANGKPAAKTTENPFTDVPADAWYLTPVLWAVENGITTGISADKFGPNEVCTRAQIVTFLYAAADKPAAEGSSAFNDVADDAWYAKPVLWAKENGITGGIAEGKFGPNNICTRAQVVTFLYKAFGNK